MATERESSVLGGRGEATAEVPPITGEPVLLTAPDVVGFSDLELLSRGEGWQSYRARQESVDRPVELRIFDRRPDLRDQPAGGPTVHDNERRVCGSFSGHAGVVPVFDSGTTVEGEPYLVTAYYPRGTLARLLEEHGPITWREATFLLEPIAVTLAEVHGCGVVHGDLGLHTVVLTDFLLPRVGGFGLAAASGAPDLPAPALDVRSLGTILWSLLVGEPTEQTPSAWLASREGEAVRDFPPSILELIERAMSDDAERQPANAAAFVTELRRAVSEAERGPGRSSGPAPTGAGPSGAGTAVPTSGAGPSGAGPSGATGRTVAGDWGDAPGDAAAGEREGKATTAVDRATASSDARYILGLVACIAAVTLVMVAAALLTGG